MEILTLNTGRKDFRLIDQIIEVDHHSVTGAHTFSNDPDSLGLESLAQLCAMHVRYLVDFNEHAFLLKINHFSPMTTRRINGDYHLRATLLAHSAHAYAYTAQLMKNKITEYKGELIIATQAYDHKFCEHALKAHYTRVFSCLKNGITTGC